ncbi:MAG: Asp-tRNA(Asn)/Glu-tRNA(Gln) amidotransferase subunit GatA [Firmicutes bacterium]|nr:Asp-tRNA(Asn)/Glu-tRNA(Gln) amidotransferase subunit GatA [Bacillota bacterium]
MLLKNKTALEIGQMIREKNISCVEVTDCYIKNIKEKNKNINAYITLCEDYAYKQAQSIQRKIDKGEILSPLAGVPMALKDNICTKDILTTCGSKMLSDFKPVYDATVVERLKNAGAVILGKLNMDEFAMGSSTETSFYGVVKNPWNEKKVAGGSSGGGAAAVAEELCAYSLGTDTGGSVRQPCSFCSVSGIKPTYGAVSRYGIIAYASSFDQVGPIGKDIKDCGAVLNIISGRDEKDATSLNEKFSPFTLKDGLKGIKIGVPKNYISENIDEDVRRCVLDCVDEFKALGAEIDFFELPYADYAVAAYYVIACAQASSNLSRYDGIRYGYRKEGIKDLSSLYVQNRSKAFGAEVKRRIMLGTYVLSKGYYDDYYRKALKARALIKASFHETFKEYDVILSPVAPTTAYDIGKNSEDPLKMYMGDIYTVSVNLAGLPAVSIPCGFGEGNMPVGVQLIGEALSENKLISIASCYQEETNHHLKRRG